MATMNKGRTYKPAPETRPVKNHEGSTVHGLAPLEILFSKVLGSFFGESTYYEKRTAEGDYKELVKTIKQIPYSDREYALKIAQLGRMHNMIQYPLEILSVCFNLDQYKGENFLDDENRSLFHRYVPRLVLRAKDLTELVSTQIAMYGFAPAKKMVGRKSVPVRNRPLPTAMRKTLTEVLQSFDEYKLSKGLGENKDVGEVTAVNKTVVSLADVLKLLRPKPKSKRMSAVYKSILEGNLEFGAGKKTFQSVNVAVGKGEATKKDLKEAVQEETVFSIVKNLKSLYEKGVLNDREAVAKIVETLTDAKKVKTSKMLPFRFYSAWKELNNIRTSSYGVNAVRDALVEALDLSIENLDKIEGFNAILIDISGSMDNSISAESSVTAKDIALILGAIVYKQGIGDVYLFASQCQKVSGISAKTSVIDLVEKFKTYRLGGGTELNNALNTVTREAVAGEKYDNLIILSDGDVYGYDEHRNYLRVGSRYGYSSSDDQLSTMIKSGVIKRLWINNLLGNKFALANTDDYKKNLITGFSERFVNIINVYNGLGMNKDIRKVIDTMLETR